MAPKSKVALPQNMSAGLGPDGRAAEASSASEDVADNHEAEEKLEKLLFGDDAYFLDGLKARQVDDQQLVVRTDSGGEDAEDPGNGQDLGAVADEHLFFLDSGAAALPNDAFSTHDYGDDSTTRSNRRPAWVDSDDDQLQVSLASNTRLRKLRNAEGEDIIGGREYIRRLRRQYERLHPTPAWANVSSNGHLHRARRDSIPGNESDISDEDVGSDMSLDEEMSMQAPSEALADLLRSAGSFTQAAHVTQKSSMRRKLRPEILNVQRTKDIAARGPSAVDSLHFHPRYPLILSSGPSSTISIHHVSPNTPNPNPLLTSLHVKKTPLHSTAFLAPTKPSINSGSTPSDSTTVYLSSRRRYFHTWSLTTGAISKVSRSFTSNPQLRSTQRTAESFHLSPCGRYVGFIGSARKGGGYINVLSTTTLQWLCTCRVDSRGGVADFAWWRNGNGLVAAGKNGECSEYDIEERQVVGRWRDEGAVGTTVIALGGTSSNSGSTREGNLGGDRWVAVGSSSGIVNVYDRSNWTSSSSNPDLQQSQQQPSSQSSSSPRSSISIPSNPTPLRALANLTTPTSHLHFSSDGQMLVMASRWKRDALRLVHLPSCTVYRNWPTDKTPLGRVSSLALSYDGSLLAVGNEQGGIRLWEIRD